MPGIVTPNETSRASGVSNEIRVSATWPVIPSPTTVTSSSKVSSAYSSARSGLSGTSSPRNAIGESVRPSSSSR